MSVQTQKSLPQAQDLSSLLDGDIVATPDYVGSTDSLDDSDTSSPSTEFFDDADGTYPAVNSFSNSTESFQLPRLQCIPHENAAGRYKGLLDKTGVMYYTTGKGLIIWSASSFRQSTEEASAWEDPESCHRALCFMEGLSHKLQNDFVTSTNGNKHWQEYRIGVLGSSGVGKSCLIAQYLHQTWGSVSKEPFKTHKKVVKIDDSLLMLRIIETTVTNQHVIMSEVESADGLLLVFDLTRKTSLKKLEGAYREKDSLGRGAHSIVLVGSKSDLVDDPSDSPEQTLNVGIFKDMSYYRVSTNQAPVVAEIFTNLCRKMMLQRGRR